MKVWIAVALIAISGLYSCGNPSKKSDAAPVQKQSEPAARSEAEESTGEALSNHPAEERCQAIKDFIADWVHGRADDVTIFEGPCKQSPYENDHSYEYMVTLDQRDGRQLKIYVLVSHPASTLMQACQDRMCPPTAPEAFKKTLESFDARLAELPEAFDDYATN